MAQDTELRGYVLGGKYRLVRQVSDGPRRVYEARHERLAGRFAAKLWPATTPWDAFRRGAELASTLRHPGVMQVLDFNCEPGAAPFLVLEWIDGARLSDILAEAGILPVERVAPLIESAAWALASAHQQGIVHQELRPEEIFVVHAPGTMREWVKLAGFGVSAALARAGTVPPSRYRAPEQRGRAAAHEAHDDAHDDGDDPQSDQYSLAAIAYELLAGVPPFDEERSRAEPLPISDLAPGVSRGVDAAIRQALATNPEERFAGVLEFARALRDAVDVATPEAAAPARRGARRSRQERRQEGRPPSPCHRSSIPLQAPRERGVPARRLVDGEAAHARAHEPAWRRAAGAATGARGARGRRRCWPSRASQRSCCAERRRRRRSPPRRASPRRRVPRPRPPPSQRRGHACAAHESPHRRRLRSRSRSERCAVVAPDAAAPDDDGAAAKSAARGGDGRGSRRATGARRRAAAPVTKAPTRAAKPKIAKAKPKLASAAPAAAAKAQPAKAPVAKAPPVKAPPPKTAPAAPAKAAAKQPAVAEAGACVLTVGSKPPADVWLDDHSLGRRTPLVRYRTACGDHKLALKRTDLDLYQMEIVTLRAGAPFKKVYPLQ